MAQSDNPFGVAAGEVQSDTREQRLKRHGLDPHDTAYASHEYKFKPLPPARPLNPAFLEAQRRIEGIIHTVRSQRPELDARAAWHEAARRLGIDISPEALPTYADELPA